MIDEAHIRHPQNAPWPPPLPVELAVETCRDKAPVLEEVVLCLAPVLLADNDGGG